MITKPTIAITSGEPAGIGPDLCVMLTQYDINAKIIVIGDPTVINQRAQRLNIQIDIITIDSPIDCPEHKKGSLTILPVNVIADVECGKLNPLNAKYVTDILTIAGEGCMLSTFDAIVTAPVHKQVINEGGLEFSGHTEFLADLTKAHLPVMMLATPGLRVALVTTHLPLSMISAAITKERLEQVINILDHDLRHRFALKAPQILVCGLNPHAGEGGYLGMEEINIIEPTINKLRLNGINLSGPFPADTIFTPKFIKKADAILAMYHDQGLPVLKYVGFGNAVNVTLGLPIIRTSVDHGTALDLSGSGKIDFGSMKYAIETAIECINNSVLTSE